MRRWFERLPVHRKLVALALGVAAVALAVALLGLSILDIWRHRLQADDDARALAQVMAENVAASLAFGEPDDATQMLQALRVRAEVTRACLFDTDGHLFASYVRDGLPGCEPEFDSTPVWTRAIEAVPVSRGGQTYGTVLVERTYADLGDRLLLTAAIGLLMLFIAAAAAYVLAERVQRAVSGPIVALAEAARAFGHDEEAAPPPLRAPPDEIGALVTAFTEMTARVRAARADLQQANQALVLEIEERRRIEEEREAALVREREASRLKDEFLATVSHELRTPLTAIAGWAHLLATGRLDETSAQRAADSIVRNTQVQVRVIDDLIDVSRLVSGKLRLAMEPLDLRDVIRAGLDAVHGTAQAKGVALQVELPDQPCRIAGDHDRLQQVIWNLLSNAVKFTPAEGTITVRVRAGAGSFLIDVEDTGAGIVPEFLPHVFDRFRQADGSLTRQYGGLGLGLAIVKELVEMHGGVVTVDSRGANHGSRFTVALPAFRHDGRTAAPAAAVRRDNPVLAGTRVLVVDDDEDAAAMMAAALTAAGAAVDVVTAPRNASTAWTAAACDVLVCDLAMPSVSGFDVLREIQQIERTHGRDVYAVAVSAHATQGHRAHSLAAGFREHLAKPVDPDVLVRAVARVMIRA